MYPFLIKVCSEIIIAFIVAILVEVFFDQFRRSKSQMKVPSFFAST